MPMGIVSNQDFEKEVNNSSKDTIPSRILNDVVPENESKIEIIERGRGKGNIEVPNVLRNIIADTHHANGREAAMSLAESFSISPSSESAYAQGATSTASYHDRPNRKTVNKTRKRIAEKAEKLTESAIDKITDEKLDELSALELTHVAKNVSSVVKNLETDDNSKENPLNISPIVIYAPQVKNENSFEMVFSKE
jgi:hypothetical protein